jgi:hypothetical protein
MSLGAFQFMSMGVLMDFNFTKSIEKATLARHTQWNTTQNGDAEVRYSSKAQYAQPGPAW